MIKEKVVYEVNGKIFDNKEDAFKEEQGITDELESVVESIFDILTTVKTLGYSIDMSENHSVIVNVIDEKLSPQWFVDKPYHSAFIVLLKELGIKYDSYEGDERRSGYLRIYPAKFEDDLGKYQIIDWLKSALPRLKAEQDQRIQDIINGKR